MLLLACQAVPRPASCDPTPSLSAPRPPRAPPRATGAASRAPLPAAAQEKQLEQLAAKARKAIPAGLDYATISTLSLEAREKLAKFRPADIGQASRIGGVSPADISALLLHLEVQRRREAAAAAAAGGVAAGRRAGPNADASGSGSSDEQVGMVAAAGAAVGA